MAFTYFFRDMQTLELIASEALPKLKANRYIDVWDAGCAHGPEPYSLAILLRENMTHFLFRNVRVFATDIDGANQFGEMISRGMYPCQELKRMPKNLLYRYFTPTDCSGYRMVEEELRAQVRFMQHDLLSLKPIRTGLSLILCKNVLLHFKEDDRIRVVEMFHNALRDGGFFATEHTQKLPKECEHLFSRVTERGQLFVKRA